LTTEGCSHQGRQVGRRTYREVVKEALIVLWEASDRICGKRLKSLLPSLIEAMERHGHLHLQDGVKEQLVAISAATSARLRFTNQNKYPAERSCRSKDFHRR
jgi:hypothetical protein